LDSEPDIDVVSFFYFGVRVLAEDLGVELGKRVYTSFFHASLER
jgi:hypothetical protein